MKKPKVRRGAYHITINQDSQERNILMMLRNIGKYLYTASDKMLKAPSVQKRWEWEKK